MPFSQPCSRSAKSQNKSKARVFAEQNGECARAILEDPARYGGEGALAVRWARKIAVTSLEEK